MKWYPWLNTTYYKILTYYQRKQQHAILLHSQKGNGEMSLFHAITCWLMCHNQEKKRGCGYCHSCKLIKVNNHPDHYRIIVEKNKLSLSLDSVRDIIDKLYTCSHQGGAKVVWIPQSELLTEKAANALLKILEEPPPSTYFLLGCQDRFNLLPTLLSRCLYCSVPSPKESIGLCWLQNQGDYSSINACTSLRLSSWAPLAALKLLKPKNWKERIIFYKKISEAIFSNNLLKLTSTLNQDKDDYFLFFLLSLLTDALKWKCGAKNHLVNLDQLDLVVMLSKRYSVMIIYNQFHQWISCRRQWNEILGINKEILITYQLLNWEKDITKKSLCPYSL